MKIILIHEKDVSKGGCDFDHFFVSAPEQLSRPPIELFKDDAIPLYSAKEYRAVSLKQLLCKIGGTQTVLTNRKKRFMKAVRN